MDRLAVAHRWLGFATVWLLVGHGVLTTIGYALGDGARRHRRARDAPDDLSVRPMGDGRVRAVRRSSRVSSVRAARRRLSYETWYGLHLYAYLAIALAFLHQLFVGADFIARPARRVVLDRPVRRGRRAWC